MFRKRNEHGRSNDVTATPKLIQLVNSEAEATTKKYEIDDDDEDDNEPLPSGQHLMIDYERC
jgi:hypothetical protein